MNGNGPVREPDGTLCFPFLRAKARHPLLPEPIELLIPHASATRPASRAFLQGKYWEPPTHSAFLAITARAPGRTVVHAGCYFGDMLHTLSLHAGRVFAFEPVLENYLFAYHNAERLGLRNVLLFHAGLSDRTAVLPLCSGDAEGRSLGGAAHVLFRPGAATGRIEHVPCLRLDDLPVEDVGLLHLDVEGSQLAALQGAARVLARDRPIVLVEDPHGLAGPFLQELGYREQGECANLRYWAVEEDADFLRSVLAGLRRPAPRR